MTLNKFVFKSHKWLAVAVSVVAVMWFVTGMVMVLPQGLAGGETSLVQDRGMAAEPSFKDVTVSVPQAIAAAQQAAGKPIEVEGVRLKRLPGKLVYEVAATNGGVLLIDAMTGQRFEVTEEAVRQMATILLGGRGEISEIVLEKQHSADYIFGPLPMYRVRVNDPAGTILYIARNTGERQSSTRLSRLRAYFDSTHSFAILRPYLPSRVVRLLLVVTATVGTAMSLFGVWILWLQWQMWWSARKARAARAA